MHSEPRTNRLFIVTVVLVGLAVVALPPRVMPGSAFVASSPQDEMSSCCCGTEDGGCCGMACCGAPAPRPDRPVQPVSEEHGRGPTLGLLGVQDGSTAWWFGRSAAFYDSTAATPSSLQISLLSQGVRLQV